ncbi:unnamed protein product, partial [Oppiella nova]
MLSSVIVTENNEILVKNLTEIDFYNRDYRLQRLPAFVDYYKNRLKSLKLAMVYTKTDECMPVLKLIPQLRALRELSLEFNPAYEEFVESIVDYHCTEFVNQLPQLKRYQLRMYCKSSAQLERLYESVGRMKGLRRSQMGKMKAFSLTTSSSVKKVLGKKDIEKQKKIAEEEAAA